MHTTYIQETVLFFVWSDNSYLPLLQTSKDTAGDRKSDAIRTLFVAGHLYNVVLYLLGPLSSSTNKTATSIVVGELYLPSY